MQARPWAAHFLTAVGKCTYTCRKLLLPVLVLGKTCAQLLVPPPLLLVLLLLLLLLWLPQLPKELFHKYQYFNIPAITDYTDASHPVSGTSSCTAVASTATGRSCSQQTCACMTLESSHTCNV
jgi:hypothetical protein